VVASGVLQVSDDWRRTGKESDGSASVCRIGLAVA
jgi:hypothetical protein